MVKKNNKSGITRNVSNSPYTHISKNYILMGKRTKEQNKSIIAENESLIKLGDSNINKNDMTII